MKILLKSFLVHIVLCVLVYFLYAWMWNIGTNWWVWTIFIISMILVCCGYISVGYWINEGDMKGIKPILLIYVLSGIIMALMTIAVFYRSETRMSPLIIANLPFILLLEFQNLISSLHGSQIIYILSGLCPSVLIHLGFNIKNHMINHKKKINFGLKLQKKECP